VNKAGQGEPSDATKPHVARPKKCKSAEFICSLKLTHFWAGGDEFFCLQWPLELIVMPFLM
jgi:hypothetical protein